MQFTAQLIKIVKDAYITLQTLYNNKSPTREENKATTERHEQVKKIWWKLETRRISEKEVVECIATLINDGDVCEDPEFVLSPDNVADGETESDENEAIEDLSYDINNDVDDRTHEAMAMKNYKEGK